MRKNQQPQNAGEVKVVYVRKEHAKTAKSRLLEAKFLDDRFRMLPAFAAIDKSVEIGVDVDLNALIAIPVYEEFDREICALDKSDNDNDNELESSVSSVPMLVGVGYQICPYSTKMLGNC